MNQVTELERATGSCGNCEIAEEFSRGVFEKESEEDCTACQNRQRVEQHVKSLIIDGQAKVDQVEENGKWLRKRLGL